jgi:N-acyl-D-aspartate/D-glutamate deacylase
VLTFEESIHFLTEMPAELYGLREPDVLRKGSYAHIAVVDPMGQQARNGTRADGRKLDQVGRRRVASARGALHRGAKRHTTTRARHR